MFSFGLVFLHQVGQWAKTREIIRGELHIDWLFVVVTRGWFRLAKDVGHRPHRQYRLQ
jgi:hypothetical protein